MYKEKPSFSEKDGGFAVGIREKADKTGNAYGDIVQIN